MTKIIDSSLKFLVGLMVSPFRRQGAIWRISARVAALLPPYRRLFTDTAGNDERMVYLYDAKRDRSPRTGRRDCYRAERVENISNCPESHSPLMDSIAILFSLR